MEIIAELAQGFEGESDLSKLLVDAASAADADAVKFQVVFADELATNDYEHYKLFQQLEMTNKSWMILVNQAKNLNLKIYFDIFGERSLELASQLNVSGIKIHPTDIANNYLLDLVNQSSINKIFLGIGGATLEEISTAVNMLLTKEIILILGFQGYPTMTDENQLTRLSLLKEKFKNSKIQLGFADHSEFGTPIFYAVPAMAIGMGATVIEKHLTLARNMKFEDYESALNPDEFKKFTEVIRICKKAMGTSVDQNNFGMTSAEINYRTSIRRHLVAAKDLNLGQIIELGDVALKRTGSKTYLSDLAVVYGKEMLRHMKKDSTLLDQDFK